MADQQSLLPPNAATTERDLEAATARVGVVPISHISNLLDPDTCPPELLAWLAWAENIEEWSSLWSVDLQRTVIKAQRAVRHKRGTKKAVVDAIEALGGSVAIKEWWQHDVRRTPHTFDVVISGGDGYVESELQDSMIRAIEKSKPLRSHYTLGVGLTAACNLNLAGVVRLATYKRMEFQG